MNDDYLTIAICNYNTTDLTNNAIKSIDRYVKDKYQIIVLDNSDELKYINETNIDVKVLDNTKKKFIDFELLLKAFLKTDHKHSNNGSFKHAYSIQFLINICTTLRMLLLDSDIIIHNELDFLNSDKIIVSDMLEHLKPIELRTKNFGKPYLSKSRFLPYILLINVEKFKNEKLIYFDPARIQGGNGLHANSYDTGASLFEDIEEKKLVWQHIDYHKYISHIGGQSWKKFDIEHKCY